jgi:Sel1 repeat
MVKRGRSSDDDLDDSNTDDERIIKRQRRPAPPRMNPTHEIDALLEAVEDRIDLDALAKLKVILRCWHPEWRNRKVVEDCVEMTLKRLEDFREANEDQDDLGEISYALGDLYDVKNSLIDQDLALAAQYYLVAARKGHVDAMVRVGCFHNYGRGMQVSHTEALRWLDAAAHSGSDFAAAMADGIRDELKVHNDSVATSLKEACARKINDSLRLMSQAEKLLADVTIVSYIDHIYDEH